ncbi:putative peptidase [Acetobacter oeni LMG 21952]|nr:putative peptidase [Acetobacter oeni LMG 21952]
MWDMIDLMAAERGLSVSGLARAAGLDPTALNPSKRRTADGRMRLPRMETLLHLLDAAGVSFSDFAGLTEGLTGGKKAGAILRRPVSAPAAEAGGALLRVIRFSRLGLPDLFDRAFLPTGRVADRQWGEIRSPVTLTGPHDYAIRLDSDAFEPVFRRGCLLIVSPDVPVREGDRILLHAPERSGAPGQAFPPPVLAVMADRTVTDRGVGERMVRPLVAGAEAVVLPPHDDRVVAQRITATTL